MSLGIARFNGHATYICIMISSWIRCMTLNRVFVWVYPCVAHFIHAAYRGCSNCMANNSILLVNSWLRIQHAFTHLSGKFWLLSFELCIYPHPHCWGAAFKGSREKVHRSPVALFLYDIYSNTLYVIDKLWMQRVWRITTKMYKVQLTCSLWSSIFPSADTLLSWFISHSYSSKWHLCTMWEIPLNLCTLVTLLCTYAKQFIIVSVCVSALERVAISKKDTKILTQWLRLI